MRLTVLGASATYPRPGEACNGYLLQDGAASLVLDFGNGCMSFLSRHQDFTRLGGIVLSHLHVDHFADLYPLYYALRFHPDRPWGLPLFAPGGALELIGRILGEESREWLPRVFAARELRHGMEAQVGGMRLTFVEARHNVEAFHCRVEGEGWSVAYSGDTLPHPGLEEAAREADLFLCEATMPRGYEKEASHGHLTSRQAGEAARRAGARELLLTHIWPTFDRGVIVREAQEAFGGPTSAAEQEMRILLKERG